VKRPELLAGEPVADQVERRFQEVLPR